MKVNIIRRIHARWSTILVALLAGVHPCSVSAQSASLAFSFPSRGGASLTSSGSSAATAVGYGRIAGTQGFPMGLAIFGLRQNNALISEATVPAATRVQRGRIYTEIGGGVNTGIAIANPNDQFVGIDFYFTDSTGRQSSRGSTTIPPNGQIAQFLTDAPFRGAPSFLGTFTFSTSSSLKVAAIALRGFTNERGEFLMTTLPVAPILDINSDLFDRYYYTEYGSGTIPHFASGGGWITQVVLVNHHDYQLQGTIVFTDQMGQRVVVSGESGSASSFNYSVPAESAWRLRTSGTGSLQAGSIKITANSGDSFDVPIGFLIFSFRPAGITVSAAGVSAPPPTTATRIFAEASGNFDAGEAGSLRTGIAIANTDSPTPIRVSIDLTTLDGQPTGLSGTLDIPSGGQVAKFLNQIPGFESLASPFQGVLRITAPAARLYAIGLRGRYNERGEFLVTAVPAANVDDPYWTHGLVYPPDTLNYLFPHFADGGGYSTQFVLFDVGWSLDSSSSGMLSFFTTTGSPLPLTLRTR